MLVLTLASTASALDWTSVENIANGASVTVSSRFGSENQICDNNTGNGWQAIGHAHEKSNDFILIDLGERKDFDVIEIWWEASHPTKYDIYVSDDAIPYRLTTIDDVEMNVIDAAWLGSHTPASSREFTANSGQDEISLGQTSGRYILVYAIELNGNGNAYGSRTYEIKVGDIPEMTPELTAFDIPEMTWIGQDIDVASAATDQLGRAMTEGVTFTVNGDGSIVDGRFVPASKGVVTITATDGVNRFDRQMIVLDLDQWVMGSARVTSDTGLGDPAALYDGGKTPSANGAQYVFVEGEPQGDAEHWVLVDLGRPVTIDAIYATWEGASSNRYDVLVGADTENMTVVGSVDEPAAVKARTDWFYGTDMKQVRYVKVATHANGTGYGLKLYELKVYGATDYEQTATRSNVYFEESFAIKGQPVHVHAYLADQYGEPMDAEVALTSADGVFEPTEDKTVYLFTPSHKGVCEVTATSGELSQKTEIICIADLDDYIMTDSNVKAVTSDLEHTEGAALYDGGAALDSNGAVYQIVKEGSDEANVRDAEHWVLVEFVGPMNLDAIYVSWEGASANRYDVAVGTDAENLTELGSIDETHGVLARKDWFYGREMKAIRFVKITTKNAASQYGTKIFDLKVYGARDIKPVSFAIDPAVRVGGINRNLDVMYTGETLLLNPVLTDNFGEAMELDGNVTYTVNDVATELEGGVFTPAAEGVYTIATTCGDFVVEPVTVSVVDSEKALMFKHKNVDLQISGLGELNAYRDVIMGGKHDEYKSLDVEGRNIVVTFREPVTLSALEMVWEADCAGSYTVTLDNGKSVNVTGSPTRVIGGDMQRISFVELSSDVEPQSRATEPVKTGKITVSNIVAADGAAGARLVRLAPVHGESNLILEEKTEDDLKNEGIATGVDTLAVTGNDAPVDVVNAQGVVVRRNVARSEATRGLAAGIYLIGSEKVLVK